MAQFVYICPVTSMNVQQWLDDDEDASDDKYEAIKCPACARLHFLSQKTGRLLGCDCSNS